jgi:hypothetical protein
MLLDTARIVRFPELFARLQFSSWMDIYSQTSRRLALACGVCQKYRLFHVIQDFCNVLALSCILFHEDVDPIHGWPPSGHRRAFHGTA